MFRISLKDLEVGRGVDMSEVLLPRGLEPVWTDRLPLKFCKIVGTKAALLPEPEKKAKPAPDVEKKPLKAAEIDKKPLKAVETKKKPAKAVETARRK